MMSGTKMCEFKSTATGSLKHRKTKVKYEKENKNIS